MGKHLALLSALIAAPLLAQSGGGMGPERVENAPPPRPYATDRRAEARPDVMAVIAEAKLRQPSGITTEDAAQIVDLILADKKFDAAEMDLLDELASSSIRTITITPLRKPGDPVLIGTASYGPQKEFYRAFSQHYQQAWTAKDQAAGWAELVRQAGLSESGHNRVRRFLGGLALEAAKASNAENRFAPTMTMISRMSVNSKALADADRVFAFKLMYEAFSDADGTLNGALPDVLYQWLGKVKIEAKP